MDGRDSGAELTIALRRSKPCALFVATRMGVRPSACIGSILLTQLLHPLRVVLGDMPKHTLVSVLIAFRPCLLNAINVPRVSVVSLVLRVIIFLVRLPM